jgi:endogenous inhibitor of DNA gyrase (YacG/DUF329 family)
MAYENYITNPMHGGKVTCPKCGAFLKEGETIVLEYGAQVHPFCKANAETIKTVDLNRRPALKEELEK